MSPSGMNVKSSSALPSGPTFGCVLDPVGRHLGEVRTSFVKAVVFVARDPRPQSKAILVPATDGVDVEMSGYFVMIQIPVSSCSEIA